MTNQKIAIGSDHAGFELKEKIKKYLDTKQISYHDFGTYSKDSCDYPKIAKIVAERVANSEFEKGILVCGSGIGMSIAANRIKKVRAALCWDLATAKSSRTHNNSNILCLGERVTDNNLVIEMVELWLNTEFEGGRHQTRIDMIED